MKKKVTVGVLSMVIVGLVSYFVYARSIIPPPTIDKVADTWIGFTEDDLNLYRLTLRKDGTGLCAFTFVREPAAAYEVTSWKLSRYNIDITLKPIDNSAEPIHIKGETTGWHLNLNVAGSGWDRDLKMYRESDLNSAYQRVHQRMTKLQKADPAEVESDDAEN